MSHDDDDDGESWVEKICNDRNYLVIGDGESLAADYGLLLLMGVVCSP